MLRLEAEMVSSSVYPKLILTAAASLCWCTMFATCGQAEGARPDVASLPVSVDATSEQLILGDRIFHGEAANGKCHECHGWDGKGTGNGNDLTVGSLIWGDSLKMIKATLHHNIAIAPGRDGDLTEADVDAVAAYVWGLVHQDRFRR